MSTPSDRNGSEEINDAIRAAYERAKREFTEADLELYAQEEEGIPLEQVLAELEELQQR